MKERIILVSGGFDPLHKGHLRMMQSAKNMADKLIVIVNSDRFLLDKKGHVFQDVEERKEIIRGIGCVDYVIEAIDDDQTVCKTLQVLADLFSEDILTFANGGDRTEADIAEAQTCEKYSIHMEFGIGGAKIQSSSELVKRFKEL